MTRLETWVANDLQNGQMIFETFNFVFGKVGHFAWIDGVGETLLQLVHDAPAILYFLAYFLGV